MGLDFHHSFSIPFVIVAPIYFLHRLCVLSALLLTHHKFLMKIRLENCCSMILCAYCSA
jgi:hypothetical protein